MESNFLEMLNQLQRGLLERGARSKVEHKISTRNYHSVYTSYKGGSFILWFKEDYYPNDFPKPINEGEYITKKIDEKFGFSRGVGVDYFKNIPHVELGNIKCGVAFFRGDLKDEFCRIWFNPKQMLISFPSCWVRASVANRGSK